MTFVIPQLHNKLSHYKNSLKSKSKSKSKLENKKYYEQHKLGTNKTKLLDEYYKYTLLNLSVEELQKTHKLNPIIINDENRELFQEIIRSIPINNTEKFMFIFDTLKIIPRYELKNWLLDESIIAGNLFLVKILIKKYRAKYSKYAKQMAIINGNIKVALYVDTFGTESSDISLYSMHNKYCNDKKIFIWDDIVPSEYQFDL